MGYSKLMSDGTVCRTGPSCKRHGVKPTNSLAGFLSSLQSRIASPKDDPTPAYTYSSVGIEDASFTTDEPITGINKHYFGPFRKNDETFEEFNAKHVPVLQQLNSESKEFEETMPQELRDSISNYVYAYAFVNDYLRYGRKGVQNYVSLFSSGRFKDPTAVDHYEKLSKERIAEMDEVFNTYERPEKNVRRLFRSERLVDGVSMEEHLAKFVPGSVITNKSYTSTTVDPDYMLVFNDPKENKNRIVVYEILSKEGIPVYDYNSFPGNLAFSEREVLLNRDSQFEVKAVTTRKFISSYPDKKPPGLHGENGIPSANFVVIQLQQV